MTIRTVFPENMLRLWRGEDDLMPWAGEVLASEEYLLDHLILIEAYMDCVQCLRVSGGSGDRFTAICGLFLRTFDSLSHCVRSAVSGNYSGGAMYARDLVETLFLIDYLLDEAGRPEAWLNADIETAKKNYKPVDIRITLDERDGYEGQKRKIHYDMLSNLGAHPTPVALNLKRDGSKRINAGPFKHREMLGECIEEATKVALMLAEILVPFCIEEANNGPNFTCRLALTMQMSKEKYLLKS